MGWVRRVVWIAWCAAFCTSLNFLLIARAPSPSPLHHRRHRTPAPSTSFTPDRIADKVYIQGEVYAIRESNYHKQHKRNRTGLRILSGLYKHLAAVRAQYSTISTHLKDLVEGLNREVTKRWVTDDPWELARKWATPKSLLPSKARGLGDILGAMATAPITAADIGYKGTQLKISILLKGGQRAVFKPKWYSREEVIEGEVYAGADRHNGEIAAFHLSRLLGLTMVPLAVGRRVSLKKHILPVASRRLSATFFRKGRQLCFYGVCYYCHKDASVCDNGTHTTFEGTVIMWLPKRLPLTHIPHPWARTYKRSKLAQWEENPQYCNLVQHHPSFSDDLSRLLDLMDTAVFDFLIQNGDRHHYTVVAEKPESSIVLLDNGKSFGDPYVDHMDVLTPLIQCCRLRQTTYDRLILLSGGGLSSALEELLKQDPIAPILTKVHLLSLDRRVLHILAALSMCRERRGGWHNVLY